MLKEALGWIGVGLVLLSFILTTLGILEAKSIVYGLLNAVGAAGIIVSSWVKKDLQPIILNIVWLIVAVIGIIRSVI